MDDRRSLDLATEWLGEPKSSPAPRLGRRSPPHPAAAPPSAGGHPSASLPRSRTARALGRRSSPREAACSLEISQQPVAQTCSAFVKDSCNREPLAPHHPNGWLPCRTVSRPAGLRPRASLKLSKSMLVPQTVNPTRRPRSRSLSGLPTAAVAAFVAEARAHRGIRLSRQLQPRAGRALRVR